MVITGQDWEGLLSPNVGGPGELPGRDEAVDKAKERSRLRYLAKKRPKK